MSASAFFDTNVLLYLLSSDSVKADRAEELLAGGGIISVQVLNEFASVACRKLAMRIPEIRTVLATVRKVCSVVAVDLATHDRGLDLMERHRLSVYDAFIVAAALQAGCRNLYSEDFQHGRIFGRLSVRNPFRS
ncbi:MAG TPA: PIN domain-containing protein [Candidatus Tyrphobacter sp.]